MYRITLVRRFQLTTRGIRYRSSSYIAENLPDICALRASQGIWDVCIYNVRTGHYVS